ncbi:MAG: hypothetical protein RLZZ297_436 [Chloroflexota bacterium]|jgi:hypothetical protein
MNPTPEWPGLSAVIHHTLYRHTLIPVEQAARRLRIRPHDVCVWAREQGIALHVSTGGFLIEAAAIESALTFRPVASRIPELRTGKQ